MGHALWYQDLLDDNLRLRVENGAVKEENRLLKARVAYLEKRLGIEVRSAREAPFEENTPSSKQNLGAVRRPIACQSWSGLANGGRYVVKYPQGFRRTERL